MTWRINFTVTNSNFNLVGYAAFEFLKNIPKKDGKQLFSEWYLEHEKGATTAFVKVSEIDAVTEWIKDKIVAEPNWADELHKEAEKLNWEYFNYAKELLQVDPAGLSNHELADKCCKLRRLQLVSHVKAISTTWFLDSNNETYSNFLRDKLKQHLVGVGIGDPIKQIEYFTLLTSPTRTNFAQEERLDFLCLLKNPSEENVHQHYEKWRWTPYGYVGPAYDLQHYKDEVQKSISLVPQVDQMIAEELARYPKLEHQQKWLIEEIKLPTDLQKYFKIARDIIWLKDFRKYCIWHGFYVLDSLTKEIAKRLHISHRQANSFLIEEVVPALVDGKIDVDLLNERDKYCMIWANESGQKIYYGEEAKKIRQSLDLEKVVVDVENGLRGACAFPGTAKGVVKIVNDVSQIDKINDGEIMLAHTTFPALLPAMKKAAAFVTEDGGITCHAAIVAREMKKPCVVGVKSACSVLNDGDTVEVDATNGVITVIARSEGRATRQSR